MKKVIMIIGLALLMLNCTDSLEKKKYLEKNFKNYKVEPATGLIQNAGYEFIIIDTNNQIIAVKFYPFSEDKISDLRNIR